MTQAPDPSVIAVRPVRVQLSRKQGWRMPENTVKVDRASKWGNPYKAGVHCDHQHAVDCHRHLVMLGRRAKTAPDTDISEDQQIANVKHDIGELRGKNLACWCALDAPCHADVLLELANAELATPDGEGVR